MKRLSTLCCAAVLALSASAAMAHDLKVDDFQVTGDVKEKTDTSITVMKGKERFQIAIDKDTKGAADIKVGDKVTLMYTMTVTSCEVKGAKAAGAKAEKAEKKAGKKGK